eukprot:9199747-Lingulodinium_polyedra.AAC.1
MFRWSQAIDHALWVCAGMGLEQMARQGSSLRFQDPEGGQLVLPLAAPERVLVIPADQQSTGTT